MALLGAIGSTLLMFVFPVIFDWKIYGFTGSGFNVRGLMDKIMGITSLSIGCYAGIVGTGAALHSLYLDILHGDTTHVSH